MDRRNNIQLVKNKFEGENAEKKDWSILLPELLKLVFSLLSVKDNIQASAVCKAWYKSGVSIRMSDRHLWFLKHPLSPRNIGPFEMYDPLQKMTYIIKFPEISGMSVRYAKDGWLLMQKDLTSELFFFNPFTRKLQSLPNCESYNECIVFTCAPTSDHCLVFGLTNIDTNKNIIGINTFKVGETRWETTCFMILQRFLIYQNKIIFLGSKFYCFDGFGLVVVFDPSNKSLSIHRPKYEGGFTPSIITWFGMYCVEINNGIYLLETLGHKPRLFRLNHDEAWIWEEKERIDEGLTLFGASSVSECRSDLPSCMRNKLLLSGSHHLTINTYFFDEGRYRTNDSCIPFWKEKTTFQGVWIEPPKLFLNFI